MDFKKKAEEILSYLYGPMMFRELPSEGLVVDKLEKALKETWNEAIEKSAKTAEIECKVYSECSQAIRELTEKI